jgi:serine/threonine protein phosphatase PrpC
VSPHSSQDEALLSNAIQYANDRVYVEGMKDAKLEGMGTTVVAVLASTRTLAVAHVGDSRVYAFGPQSGLRCVTRDHSLLNYKIDQGEISTEEEIRAFRQGNIIVRAIGLKDYVYPEVQTIDRCPGEILLLCSDGLTDLISDELIEAVLHEFTDDLDGAASRLIEMANGEGGKDNITVMLLRVDDDPQSLEDDNTYPDVVAVSEEVTDPAGVEAIEEVTDPLGTPVMLEEVDDLDTLREADTLDDIPAVEHSAVDESVAHARAPQRVQVTSGAHTVTTRRPDPSFIDQPSVIVELPEE